MKRLVILGGGESGVGTALLGIKKGYNVFVSDKGKIKEEYKKVLKHFEIDWEEEQHTESKILNADLVMKSPGIPDKVTLVQKLLSLRIPVISEIEFASKYTDAIIIGITGSNGKTTTTMMVNHILEEEGLHVGMAGNIGDSYAKMVSENNFDYYVLEISSFQLDGIVDFKPHIAIITNITPDHLDRYNYEFDNYIASKFRIAENQTKEDYLIYDADDEVLVSWLENHPVKSKLIPFSIEKQIEEGVCLKNDKIHITTQNNTIEMATNNLALEGKHNLKNTMAASAASKLVNIRKATIRASIENFQGASHRLESVLKIAHVHYVNDSKATNVNATYYALESMKSATVWIVGGVDKGNDYKSLMPLVREKVKAIICLGVDNSKIIEEFGNVVDLVVETQRMDEAVKMAYKIGQRGDTVLLSPACASFDLFENYEDRGNQFKAAVKSL
ncbi:MULTISPECIES: UDP-N-acetylmuramoyl-L-alanine--D-glutamate ligase [unclassified Cellulophaga]|uniref:UDP-N-acetylmuramoyl-L-alanine--D-glutamate ligase n=1 Tax=unclassified Cellulophaga TaxID=2634405 RepID=UPI0026E22EAE|nr:MULTISPECIES: UDP-N-acetylmuramoyl-L-alanine--D-glutamate ligase [unclassified Cellulophaga]MDO6490430.1 UDP-N-acetylmuramoyl-L-alanine--D-glutamate ligase [Cellulophaga sp. 2_MG-2023]MDO6494376.1 UDP-N-acetylmuramoyl-L-alanine--D-glutamate ligase [Cellulophaga sp. 3_MG-2023]